MNRGRWLATVRSKILNAGIRTRVAKETLEDALGRWLSEMGSEFPASKV